MSVIGDVSFHEANADLHSDLDIDARGESRLYRVSHGDRALADDTETAQFFDRRERELTNRLEMAWSAAAQFKAELTAVQKARTAFEESLNASAKAAFLAEALQSPPDPPPQMPFGLFHAPFGSGGFAEAVVPPGTPSIKQLIVASLRTNRSFRMHGASVVELLSFIKDTFNREIERSSFSPQLSRLKDEGTIRSFADGKWQLVDLDSTAPTKNYLAAEPSPTPDEPQTIKRRI